MSDIGGADPKLLVELEKRVMALYQMEIQLRDNDWHNILTIGERLRLSLRQ